MSEPAYISVPAAGRRVFGVGKAQSFAYAQKGLIPVVRVGRRCLVPVAALDKLTAELAAGAAESAASNWHQQAATRIEAQ
jgi:hypothetical protein